MNVNYMYDHRNPLIYGYRGQAHLRVAHPFKSDAKPANQHNGTPRGRRAQYPQPFVPKPHTPFVASPVEQLGARSHRAQANGALTMTSDKDNYLVMMFEQV